MDRDRLSLLGAFSHVTSEFLPVGLLPDISREIGPQWPDMAGHYGLVRVVPRARTTRALAV